MLELTWLRRPDTVCPSGVRMPTVTTATRARMSAYSKSICPFSSSSRRTASVQRFLIPPRCIRTPLPLRSFLSCDRRAARGHAGEDALHVENGRLQDRDGHDCDERQDQGVLDERLTFLPLETCAQGGQNLVRLHVRLVMKNHLLSLSSWYFSGHVWPTEVRRRMHFFPRRPPGDGIPSPPPPFF